MHKHKPEEIILMLCLVALALWLIYKVWKAHLCEDDERTQTPIRLRYYYRPGCQHCEEFKPKLQAFLDNNDRVEVVRIDCDDPDNLNTCAAAIVAGMKGFPHVTFAVEDNEALNFRGERSMEALQEFYDTLLAMQQQAGEDDEADE